MGEGAQPSPEAVNRKPLPTSRLPRPYILLFLLAAIAVVPALAGAKPPPAPRGPIARMGDRSVEAVDILQAALSLGVDAPTGMTPKAWRRVLLDRCVDRELLALEASRRGFYDDPAVRRATMEREFSLLMPEIVTKVLLPGIRPEPEEFATIKASGRYRYLDLHYILLRDDPSHQRLRVAERIADRARQGAKWDSLSKIYSGHPPSAAAGGRFGPVLVKDLEPASQDSIVGGNPGDIFGPYSGPYGHEIYKIGGWLPIDDDSLMRLLIDERSRGLTQDYFEETLKKYRFTVDSTNAVQAKSVFRSEAPDSILASLGPDGTRGALGVRPAVGVLGTADGIRVAIADVIREARPGVNARDRVRIRDDQHYRTLIARVLLHELIVRDAKERGFDQEPLMARRLRLARDETATRAMVAKARPVDPLPDALRAYAEKRAGRYRKPAVRLARGAYFPDADSAHAALRQWNGVGFPADSTLRSMGFRLRPRTEGDFFPGQAGIVEVPEGSAGILSLALRALDAGQFAPVVQTPTGWAVAMMTGREDAAPLSEDETARRALRDWREETENEWVMNVIERLRAKTPVTVIPARLEAVRMTRPLPARAEGRTGR